MRSDLPFISIPVIDKIKNISLSPVKYQNFGYFMNKWQVPYFGLKAKLRKNPLLVSGRIRYIMPSNSLEASNLIFDSGLKTDVIVKASTVLKFYGKVTYHLNSNYRLSIPYLSQDVGWRSVKFLTRSLGNLFRAQKGYSYSIILKNYSNYINKKVAFTSGFDRVSFKDYFFLFYKQVEDIFIKTVSIKINIGSYKSILGWFFSTLHTLRNGLVKSSRFVDSLSKIAKFFFKHYYKYLLGDFNKFFFFESSKLYLYLLSAQSFKSFKSNYNLSLADTYISKPISHKNLLRFSTIFKNLRVYLIRYSKKILNCLGGLLYNKIKIFVQFFLKRIKYNRISFFSKYFSFYSLNVKFVYLLLQYLKLFLCKNVKMAGFFIQRILNFKNIIKFSLAKGSRDFLFFFRFIVKVSISYIFPLLGFFKNYKIFTIFKKLNLFKIAFISLGLYSRKCKNSLNFFFNVTNNFFIGKKVSLARRLRVVVKKYFKFNLSRFQINSSVSGYFSSIINFGKYSSFSGNSFIFDHNCFLTLILVLVNKGTSLLRRSNKEYKKIKKFTRLDILKNFFIYAKKSVRMPTMLYYTKDIATYFVLKLFRQRRCFIKNFIFLFLKLFGKFGMFLRILKFYGFTLRNMLKISSDLAQFFTYFSKVFSVIDFKFSLYNVYKELSASLNFSNISEAYISVMVFLNMILDSFSAKVADYFYMQYKFQLFLYKKQKKLRFITVTEFGYNLFSSLFNRPVVKYLNLAAKVKRELTRKTKYRYFKLVSRNLKSTKYIRLKWSSFVFGSQPHKHFEVLIKLRKSLMDGSVFSIIKDNKYIRSLGLNRIFKRKSVKNWRKRDLLQNFFYFAYKFNPFSSIHDTTIKVKIQERLINRTTGNLSFFVLGKVFKFVKNWEGFRALSVRYRTGSTFWHLFSVFYKFFGKFIKISVTFFSAFELLTRLRFNIKFSEQFLRSINSFILRIFTIFFSVFFFMFDFRLLNKLFIRVTKWQYIQQYRMLLDSKKVALYDKLSELDWNERETTHENAFKWLRSIKNLNKEHPKNHLKSFNTYVRFWKLVNLFIFSYDLILMPFLRLLIFSRKMLKYLNFAQNLFLSTFLFTTRQSILKKFNALNDVYQKWIHGRFGDFFVKKRVSNLFVKFVLKNEVNTLRYSTLPDSFKWDIEEETHVLLYNIFGYSTQKMLTYILIVKKKKEEEPEKTNEQKTKQIDVESNMNEVTDAKTAAAEKKKKEDATVVYELVPLFVYKKFRNLTQRYKLTTLFGVCGFQNKIY